MEPNAPDPVDRRAESMRSLGAAAEEQAVGYLVGQGYEILDRNYQVAGGEINCIARDRDGTVVFVEVKATWADSGCHPFFRIGRSKQKNLVKTAKRWLYENGVHDTACRFDCIAVVGGNLEHLKDAFWAS